MLELQRKTTTITMQRGKEEKGMDKSSLTDSLIVQPKVMLTLITKPCHHNSKLIQSVHILYFLQTHFNIILHLYFPRGPFPGSSPIRTEYAFLIPPL